LLQAHRIFDGAYQLVSKDPAQAIPLYERSRDLFIQLGDECSADIAELWAAQFLLDVKRIAECRLRMHAIIERAESRRFLILLPPAYYWLGMSDYSQGLPSESARNLKRALQLAESDNDIFEIQHVEDALTKHYTKLGELEPALAYASKRLSDQGLYDHRVPNQYLRDRETLAELMLKLSFRAASLSLSKDALTFARENLPNDVRLNDSLRHTASAALARKDFTGALQYANDSLQIALKRGESAEAAVTKAKIYQLLGDIKGQANNCGEALDDYSRALELYRLLPEMTVNSYQIHKGKLFCFQELGEHEQFVEELKTIMDLSESYRRNIREDASRQAFFANEQDVFDAAVENALQEQDWRQAFALVEDSKARSLLEFVESGKSIAEVEGDFGSVASRLSLGGIQTRLPEQVELVQYAVLPDRLAIWTVSKTRFDFLQKQISAVELEKKVAEYQALIVAKGAPGDIRQAGRELYDLLIPPGLDGGKQICLAPDKSLHQLAFATLVSNAGKYLLEDHVLFYAPSASILVLATEKAQAKVRVANESLLSVGNPDFDREENPNLPDLQDAEAEAIAIADLYKNPTELLSSGATKEKFLLSFANVEVIHFAGHFVANPLSPANSKLLFAGGELRSSELGSYHLPKAKLVVMSACETGFERYNKSEGAIGIARTLLALGAPLVLASQWKVDSEPTKDLMIAFHRNRKQNGMTSAEGLRRAQLEMLGQDATKAPFYWAAFSLFGGYAEY
jgi:CHAT domain-containing protein